MMVLLIYTNIKVKIHHWMSNDMPDNQQETAQKFFYYTGFCCGELSCSLLKLSNRKSKTGGVYYTPDITISNSDRDFLGEVNKVIVENEGVITITNGGYNLSIRGKRKVKKVLFFFRKYPPIIGDITFSKLALINQAIRLLEERTSYKRSKQQQKSLEEIRVLFRKIKKTALPIKSYEQLIFDAEGSVGLKQSGQYMQPFFAIAMREKKIINLFKDFLKMGHIHKRVKEKMLHFEINSKNEVQKALEIFCCLYPSKLKKMRKRISRLHWILNDYTPSPKTFKSIWKDIV